MPDIFKYFNSGISNMISKISFVKYQVVVMTVSFIFLTLALSLFVYLFLYNIEKLEPSQKLLGFFDGLEKSIIAQCRTTQDLDSLVKVEYSKIPGKTCQEKSIYLCENSIYNRGFGHNKESIPSTLSVKCFDTMVHHCNHRKSL